MSPRREDYIPSVVLPKIGSTRLVSRSQSCLSLDVDSNSTSSTSEYRLRFPNHHPQPSRIFDSVPTSINSKTSARLESSFPSFLKNTEYQERFSDYHSYVPIQELVPPHLPSQHKGTPSLRKVDFSKTYRN